jgi:acetylserotonin N-methyltransferase
MFFAACELGIFEQLTHGSSTPAQLAEHLKVHPAACHSLLMGLAQMGLVRRETDSFRNTELSLYLTSAAPTPLEPLAMWGSLFAPMWSHLSDGVRENSPRWQQTFGATQQETFTNLYQDPLALRRFGGLMNAYSVPQGKLLAGTFDFTPHSCVLDVASGPGGLIIEVGRKYPHLRGIVMDLPPVCALADEAILAAGLADRYHSQFADLFQGPYPAGADVVSLSWVLHDWNDEHCHEILRHCYNALPVGGKLLITESVLDHDRSGTPFAVLMSLHMLLLCEAGARERTSAEYRSLLEATGFRLDRLVRLDAPRDLMIATKL